MEVALALRSCALNVKYCKHSDALTILQESRLKSNFRDPRGCLID